jgi:hypothetical protein
MKGAGGGLADTLALLAQVIAGHPRSSYQCVGPIKYGRNGFVTDCAAAPVAAVKHQRGDHGGADLPIRLGSDRSAEH